MSNVVWQSESDYETIWSGCEQYTESIEEIAEKHVFNSIKNCKNVEEFNKHAYDYYSNTYVNVNDKYKYDTWYKYYLDELLDKYYFSGYFK
jgi:hypothetical protein